MGRRSLADSEVPSKWRPEGCKMVWPACGEIYPAMDGRECPSFTDADLGPIMMPRFRSSAIAAGAALCPSSALSAHSELRERLY